MAIVRMNKLTVAGLDTYKDAIIEKLMKLGTVEITDLEGITGIDGLEGLAVRDGEEAAAAELEGLINRIGAALDCISGYDKRKRELFEPKRAVDRDRYAHISQNRSVILETVEQIEKYLSELSQLKTEENRLLTLITSLEPWKRLDIPLEALSTKSTVVLTGTVPPGTETGKLLEEFGEKVPESYLEQINEDKDQKYILALVHKACEEEGSQVLKQFGFSRTAFKDLNGTAESNINEARKKIRDIEKERSELEARIAAIAGEKENLQILHDILEMEKDRKKVLSRLLKTDRTFMLEGWLPEENSEKVKRELLEEGECLVDVREPGSDEEYPVLLKNNTFVQPFEMITELYSLPSSKGIDPNMFLAPFYFLFFGLMVSDAGYGLIMSAAAGVILIKFKLEGLMHKLVKMLFFGGISTFIWGVLFGGWFGNIVDAVTSGRYTIPPLWFNPLDNPMKLLLWSFIFGGLHIFTGMGLKAYILIRDGKTLDAIYDVFSWYLVLIGLVMLAGGGAIAAAGKYMALAGAAILVLTQGRGEKGIVRRLLTGILSLYNVTGFLSDILSYSRLLALGLATGVIATVINTMGTLFGINPFGIAVLAAVFVIGTVFNIAINALGAYVHASRLQYVEFFGKFYEGGGRSFKPFKIKTKYINFIDGRHN